MKNSILTAFLISLTTLSTHGATVAGDSLSIDKPKTIEEKALMAIQTDDFEYMEEILENRIINPRTMIHGKPLIIHAAIYDKAEMILLLAQYGAMIIEPTCENGKGLMEYAREYKAIHAQAQIIVIQA